MKAKELAKELLLNPENEVWCGVYNGHVETYAAIDFAINTSYDILSNDFYGTPGRMDARILRSNTDGVTYIGSRFGIIPNPDIDFGSDDIDYDLKTLNDDPYYIWKVNNFSEDGDVWYYQGSGWYVSYNMSNEILEINNQNDNMKFIGKVVGIESLREILRLCLIPLSIRS